MMVLTTWDPYRVFLDESFSLDLDKDTELLDYNYEYTIDNDAIRVMMPLAE